MCVCVCVCIHYIISLLSTCTCRIRLFCCEGPMESIKGKDILSLIQFHAWYFIVYPLLHTIRFSCSLYSIAKRAHTYAGAAVLNQILNHTIPFATDIISIHNLTNHYHTRWLFTYILKYALSKPTLSKSKNIVGSKSFPNYGTMILIPHQLVWNQLSAYNI
jgi:hypothetical protein